MLCLCQQLLTAIRSRNYSFVGWWFPFILLVSLPAWGEGRLIALGAARKLPLAVQKSEDDWLAPIASVLPDFGAKVEYNPDLKTLRIESADGRAALLTVGKAELVTGSTSLKLLAAPALTDGHFLVPVLGVARWLGLSVRVNGQGDIELNHSVMDLRTRGAGEKFVVEIVTSDPVSYTCNRLSEPDRVYVDIKNAKLSASERTVEVDHPLVRGVRAAEFSEDPAVTRLVIDLKGDANFTVSGGVHDSRIKVVIEPAKPKGGEDSHTPSGPLPLPDRRTFPDRSMRTPRTHVAPEEVRRNDWKDLVIVVDAGHGGKDSGAHGTTGILEKDLTLDIAKRLEVLLKETGVTVIMTRTDDSYPTLNDRVVIAERCRASLFVSVHINASPAPNQLSGTEVYYYNPQSLPLARSIHQSMIGELGRKDGGIRKRRFYVIHHTTMPAVLTETAYINHKEEEPLLSTPEFRQQAATAIFDGIRDYVENEKRSTPSSAASTVVDIHPEKTEPE